MLWRSERDLLQNRFGALCMRSRSPLLLSREPENQARPGKLPGDVACASSRFVALPFCELGPASTDEVLGIIGRHLDGAIWSDVEVPADDAQYFIRAGWTKLAEWKSDEAA